MKSFRLRILPALLVLAALTVDVPARGGTIFHSKSFFPSQGSTQPQVATVFGLLNPGVLSEDRVTLNPQPLPPGKSQGFDLSDSTRPSISIDQPARTDGSFIYFGLNIQPPGGPPDPVPFSIDPAAFHATESMGSFGFLASDRLGDTFAVHVGITSPEPINPGSFVSLNPQPLPPGASDFGGLQAISFRFASSALVDPPLTVEFDITNLSNGQLLSFDAPVAVPEPATLTLASLGLVGFLGCAARKRRKSAAV